MNVVAPRASSHLEGSETARSVVWLTKRKYMGQDLLENRYGRYYEIPRRLSQKHDVHVLCLDYSGRGIERLQLGPGRQDREACE